MEYTIKKLSSIAGISTRTLRYYDEINILKPARINSSGYRIYCQNEVRKLQQILFYRELGVSLDIIKDIISSPSFDEIAALKSHHERLLEKQNQLSQLISNVEKTIAATEGRIKMTDKEKFEGFKKNLVEENEARYGNEIRERYGNETVDRSNQKMMKMSKEDYDEASKLAEEILTTLNEAYKTNDPSSPLAQKTAELHHKWITLYWDHYSKEAHVNLAQMYVDDERFKEYYNKEQEGLAEFLRDSIFVYTGINI